MTLLKTLVAFAITAFAAFASAQDFPNRTISAAVSAASAAGMPHAWKTCAAQD